MTANLDKLKTKGIHNFVRCEACTLILGRIFKDPDGSLSYAGSECKMVDTKDGRMAAYCSDVCEAKHRRHDVTGK